MQRKDDFTEVSRKSRVKMHKSGKHWVRTVMSQIGLMRIGGKSSASPAEVNLATVKRSMTASQLLRGLAAAGAVVGGNVAVETVMASEVVATSETSTSTLAEADTVVLTTVVDSDSISVSSSESTSISESASQSESTSASESTSISESESLSSSESVSNSESQSASESLSVSESTSVSHSESESASTTLSSSTSSETSTSESAASDTGSETSASETDATTVAEEKQTLEQVVSEAEVLVQIASNQTAPSQALLTAIGTSRDQLLLAQTILGDADATAADLATIISSLQTSNQAIGLLLLENDEDGIITFALNTSTTATVTKVGEGYGILVDTLSTASPSMDDANGAAISNPTNNTSFTPSSESERFTFNYSKFNWFGDQLSDKTIRENYYFRYSLDYDSSTTTTYIELVNKTTNTVVESHTLDKGETATFTYFQSYEGANNLPLTITYGDSTSSSTTSGELQLQYNGGTLTNTLVPTYQEYTTYYKTTDGKTIATYTIKGIGGQMATPSGVRTFTGYDYARTTGGTAVRLYSPGTIYNDGAISTSYIKRLAEVVDENGSVVKTIWVKDPTYTGTVDYNSTDTTGFIKVMETSVMAPGTANTSLVVPVTDIISAEESALATANAQAGKTGNDIFSVIYEDNYQTIRIGFDGYAKAAKSYPVSMLVQVILKSGHPDYAPNYTNSAGNVINPNTKGSSVNLANGLNSTTVNETTHWYRVDTSESESLSNSNSHSLSESESTSNSESASNSESISNSESLSNSESTSNSESLSNSISESVRESVSESISESVKESVSESISESVKESVSESISESVKESVSESISESVKESVSESISESVKESVSESISESVSESISES
ncbi:KxYKxGKxW signal peptide domain-containing protein, partial [Streptococcus sp. A27]